MKRPTVQISAIALALVTPFLASAQTTGVQGLFTYALNLINGIIVPLIFAIAFLMFIFKVYQYFIAGGANEEKVGEGRKFVVWSMLGFFLMFSIWGLINILIASIGFDSNARPAIPTFGNTTTTGTGASSVFTGSTFTGTGSANTNPATAQTTSGTTMVNGYPYANSFTPAGTSCNNSLYTYANGVCTLNAASSASGPANGTVGSGGSCAGHENACQNGLTCNTTTNTCVAIAANGTVGQGGSCLDNENACQNGLICDTQNSDTCVAIPANGTAGAGASCLGNENACQNGFTCDSQNTDTCVAIPGNGTVGNGGSCLDNENACQDGLTCNTDSDTCVPDVNASSGGTGGD